MICLFSTYGKKGTAYFLFILFYFQFFTGSLLAADTSLPSNIFPVSQNRYANRSFSANRPVLFTAPIAAGTLQQHIAGTNVTKEITKNQGPQIGGPSSPEAASFKAAGADNLVNLFTGDLSYNIPLLDVGGYPVNLFYSAGISMEQEASWVGLGWNLNPGTVSRNMRGVPDDFNGRDTLRQTQNVKPNRTWGGEVGINGELLGISKPKINLSLGFSYNNYLGPAIDLGAGVSLTLPITESIKHDKEAPKDSVQGISASLGVNAKLSSRSGLTLSPSINANLHSIDHHMDAGIGLSTSYNSRTGIKDLNISSQVSMYKADSKDPKDVSPSRIGMNGSSTISFARPTYIPTLKMPMQYANYSGQLELGAGMFGLRGGAHAQGYYSESKIPVEWQTQLKPLVGFIYSEAGVNNKDAVMDFNRLNDGAATPRTPILSAPQYAYDIFSIQGEGTGGTIRAYRGDLGFMKDNETISKDQNISIGADIAPVGHFGLNWNIIKTPTRSGGWEDGNNSLKQNLHFESRPASEKENVYFKNPGEATVTNTDLLDRIGGDNLVRFAISGSNVNPRLESKLELFDKNTQGGKGQISPAATHWLNTRDKRTQVTTILTAAEATKVGLEKNIRNYNGAFDNNNKLVFDTITRVKDYRKSHHISEIDVLEQSGMRYIYGIPVYNIKQKDFTFSVNNVGNPVTGLVNFNADEPTTFSRHMDNKAVHEGYVSIQETPGYASSFLLTGLLSPDYVDLTGNGISEDDAGSAVKFNYAKSAGVTKWRTPRNNASAPSAHFNEGLKSEKKDDKATISYGEKEVWYLSSIESKSLIAIFKTGARDDGKGVKGEFDGTNETSENITKRLDRIDLYTKSEIASKGITNARPVKTVHFGYSYTLCAGTPDNKTGAGKLTLDSVYFTYNGQPRAKKDLYLFNYGNINSAIDNPSYANNASDKWGTYKNPDNNEVTNPISNPAGMSNAEWPFTSQDKQKNDEYAAVWSLKKILLPSGGQMDIQYEGDDYGYVQNRRACSMYKIIGFGTTPASVINNSLYQAGINGTDHLYVYLQVPELIENSGPAAKAEVAEKYLESLNQLVFKLMVQMPKGYEPLTVYTTVDDYGVCSNRNDHIYVKLTPRDGKSPLVKSTLGFLTENLTNQAFDQPDLEVTGVKAFLEMMGSMLGSLKNAFTNAEQQMRNAGRGRVVNLSKSYVRLANSNLTKYGGGIRVKRVILKDNWNRMANRYLSQYGQDYEYSTSARMNGKDVTVSSGVASYEPGIGSEENPFREIVSFSNKMPLASAQYGAIEMPMLEGFYPAPSVGYSKVTVRSIHRKGTHGDSTLRSGIGKQVTEFYTAKEFPVHAAYTPMSSKDYHYSSFLNFLKKELTDRRVTSQGFLVETNDMHGKMKSQAAYSESDEKTPLSYSYHVYRNTGKKGLNDKVDFIQQSTGGTVTKGNIGIDAELMTDVREFSVKSDGYNGQIQTDFFTFVPWPFFVVPMLPIKTVTENRYRAVTCTKLINYHAIEDSVIVMDKGSIISTKTIAYDAETGTPLLTETANEFRDPIYNLSYPAYWAYSGAGPAYQNIDVTLTADFANGVISLSQAYQNQYFESGDELLIISSGNTSNSCAPQSAPSIFKLWAYDLNKNNTALTVLNKNLRFIDADGRMYNRNNVKFRIIRSGKRNNLGMMASSITTMKNPVQNNQLTINSFGKIVSATATEYKEKWQVDNDRILHKDYYTPSCTADITDSIKCGGEPEKMINPYQKGLVGNFRPYRSMVFYGERMEINTSTPTAIRKNGYLKDFSNYWNFNNDHNLVPDQNNTKWVWNSEVTKVNSKGQDLETRNALNIYTSAQYGFQKSMATAMANNSRLNEMFAESFEDNSYGEALNYGNIDNECAKNQIDFHNLPGSLVIDLTDSVFGAHTGNRSLKVNPGTFYFPLTTGSVVDNFNIPSPPVITKATLSNPGTVGGAIGGFCCGGGNFPAHFTAGGIAYGASIDAEGNQNGSPTVFYDCYVNIATGGMQKIFSNFTYTPSLITHSCYGEDVNCSQDQTLIKDSTQIEIKTVGDESLYLLRSTTQDYFDPVDNSYNVFLEAGTYKISGRAYLQIDISGAGTDPNCHDRCIKIIQGEFTTPIRAAACSTYYTFYQNLNTVTCTYTGNIKSTDTMRNAIFQPLRGKKMHFSAWVHEDCSTPCNKLSFNSSYVQLACGFGTCQTIYFQPAGPIIEGWQKIEGDFTFPEVGDFLHLEFVNGNNTPNYWDDIRIHPFNSNMKSYVYDARTLRLAAELDENNYASVYEYDEEGQLVRTKKETIGGVKTINETRAAKQKLITSIQ